MNRDDSGDHPINEKEFLFNLALFALSKNEIDRAIHLTDRLLELSPNELSYICLMGELFTRAQKYENAKIQFQKAICIAPQNAQPHYNLGILYYLTDCFSDAVIAFQRAIELKPEWPEAWLNLGGTLNCIGHNKRAFQCWKKLLTIEPNNSLAHFNCARHYEIEGKLQQAIKSYKKTISIKPEYADAWYYLAGTLIKQRKWKKVVYCYKKVITLEPCNDRAHYNLAVTLERLEQIDEAIQHCRRALEITPQFAEAMVLLFKLAQNGCYWSFAEQLAPKLDGLSAQQIKNGIKAAENPMISIRRCTNPCANLAIAKSRSKSIEKQIEKIPNRPHLVHHRRLDTPKIRVGYISHDFTDHAVAHHIRGLINCHDRNKFSIYLYACNGEDGSYYRRQFVSLADHFVEIGNLNDINAAQQIFNDDIDILVDLTGYSRGGRMEIMALRPAPIQVSYLGFLGSSGSSFIDYLITDAIVTPIEQAGCYTEKLVYLPDCYQVNDNQLSISNHCYDRNELGYLKDNLVLCSFNQPYKIDRATFTAWLKIMKAVPESRLWLLRQNQTAVRNLRYAAENVGISGQRIQFSGPLRIDNHLARLKVADLALDTFPYNGGATTANALWAGVPVLTLMGNHFVSRMSASALMAMGLPELVSQSEQDYVQTAIELLNDRQKLKQLRSKTEELRGQSTLFNTKRFTLNLERAFEMMLKRFNSDLAPSPIVIESVDS